MLKQPVPSFSRWIAGSAVVGMLAVGGGVAAWAAQPQREVLTARQLPAGMLMTKMQLSIDGSEPQQFTMVSRAGEPFVMRTQHAGQRWEIHATATPYGDGTIAVVTTLSRDGQLLGTPKLVVRDGKKAAITIGEQDDSNGVFKGIALEMTVSAAVPATARAPSPPPSSRASLMPGKATAEVPTAPARNGGLTPAPTSAAPSSAMTSPESPPALGTSSRAVVAQRTPAPPYPAAAIAQKIGGRVVLEIDIDANGKPINVEVMQSEPAGVFDQAAIDAVMKWQFKPELKNGKPVAGRVRVPIQFVPPAAPRPSSSSNLSTVGEQVAAGAIEILPSQLLALNLSPQYRWVRIDQLKQRDVSIECDIGTGSLAAPDGQRYCGHRL